MQVRFWGVRGSHPMAGAAAVKYGGNTSCVEITAGKRRLVFDAGTGIIGLGRAVLDYGPVDMDIFISHMHWDHIQGLPFFIPAYIPTSNIRFRGPGVDSLRLELTLHEQMTSPFFPVEIQQWGAATEFQAINEGERMDLGDGLTVRSILVQHPGVTFGYRIEHEGKSVAYFPDNELAYSGFGDESNGIFPEADEEMRALMMKSAHDERGKMLRFIQGADLWVQDAQYTPDEYSGKEGWGHSSWRHLLNALKDAEVGAAALFHHDPGHDDARLDAIGAQVQAEAAKRGIAAEVFMAREGATIDI